MRSWQLTDNQKHGVRDLPTATYPDKQGVTLATTKQQEILTFVRASGPPGEETTSLHLGPSQTWHQLHEINQPIIYITGKQSHVSNQLINERKMQKTPNAEVVVIEDTGHLVPLEKPLEAGKWERRPSHMLIKANAHCSGSGSCAPENTAEEVEEGCSTRL